MTYLSMEVPLHGPSSFKSNVLDRDPADSLRLSIQLSRIGLETFLPILLDVVYSSILPWKFAGLAAGAFQQLAGRMKR